jgi:RNA polymerase sigma factor (sigma-70 family)
MPRGPLETVLRHLRRLAEAGAGRDLSDGELLDRFRTGGEEAAFALLVQRHGSMVLGVCHRVLGDEHAAEDAFQATFLVLASKAGCIRRRASVASWLYGVARRIAAKAKVEAARRRRREQRYEEMPHRQPGDEMACREVRQVLDEELGELPDKYRAPLILCHLEGKSQSEAARELGWARATLADRLARGRELLRGRLVRRGLTLSAGFLTSAVVDGTASATVPALLVLNTARAALASTGKSAGAFVSMEAAALAEGVIRTMTTSKLKIGAILAVGLALTTAGIAGHRQGAKPETPPPAGTGKALPDSGKRVEAASEGFIYAGRVLDPDGKPLAGAKLFICGLTPGVIEFRERATSGPDGTFRFTLRRDEFGKNGVVPPSRSPPERDVHIGATADGSGAACVWAGKPEEREKLVLWLPAEEIVKGRIINLEGRPIAGVSVSAYIRSSRSDKDHKPLPYDAPSEPGMFSGNVLPFEEGRNSAVTDQDGRFTLHGLSRGWLYDLSISGPTVVNVKAQLVVRPQKARVVGASGEAPPNRPSPRLPLYGSTFTHVAVPSKPIVGVVREKGSGKPLAGVEVGRPWTRDDDPQAWTTTGKDGCYKLTGLPAGIHTLRVQPPANSPYLMTEARVTADQPGIEPVTFDIQLERRQVVAGRVIDRATGAPVEAWIEYRPLAKNPNLKADSVLAQPAWGRHPPSTGSGRDGRFMLPVLRGPGVLLVSTEGNYLPARLQKADQDTWITDKEDPELIDCRPLLAWPGDFHAYRPIDVLERGDVKVEIALTPAKSRPLAIELPDGKPRDTTVLGLQPISRDHGAPYFPGKSVIGGLTDGESRRLFVSTYDSEFAAAAVNGNETGPVKVKLKRTGVITGRVVDKDGKPIVGVSFQLFFDDGPGRPGVFIHGSYAARAWTTSEAKRSFRTHGYYEKGADHVSLAEESEDQGRFRLTGVLPDVAFDLIARLVAPPNAKGQRFITATVRIARPTVKPGQTLDLGDLPAVALPKK